MQVVCAIAFSDAAACRDVMRLAASATHQRGRLISIGTKLDGLLTARSLPRLYRLEFTNIPPQKAKDVMACWRFLSLSFIVDVSFR